MFGDMAAADSSMAMAFYQLQGQGHTTSSTSYDTPHHHNMLSFTGTLMPPATTGDPPPNPSSLAVSAPKYKFVTCSPADWTAHELATLEEGLLRLLTLLLPAFFSKYCCISRRQMESIHQPSLFARYAREPNITKYINIAAMLPAKTIRDVALRCCWAPVSTLLSHASVSVLLLLLRLFITCLFFCVSGQGN